MIKSVHELVIDVLLGVATNILSIFSLIFSRHLKTSAARRRLATSPVWLMWPSGSLTNWCTPSLPNCSQKTSSSPLPLSSYRRCEFCPHSNCTDTFYILTLFIRILKGIFFLIILTKAYMWSETRGKLKKHGLNKNMSQNWGQSVPLKNLQKFQPGNCASITILTA